MAKKPKGFGAFDKLMRKLVRVKLSDVTPIKGSPQRKRRKRKGR